MPGQVTIRIRYRDRITPWFDLLCVSPPGLDEVAAPTGWRLGGAGMQSRPTGMCPREVLERAD
jgi:hypothetical protein